MLLPVDLGNPVNRGASLNLGLAHWYRGLPNNRGTRTIFDLCKAANFTITDGSGYATAMWSPKHALCDFSPVGGVSPAWCGTSDSNLADFSNGFTASAWIFPVEVGTYNVVAGVTSSGVTSGFYFGQLGTALTLNAGGGAASQTVGPNIAAYSLSFAVWVCSGGSIRLYVDSIEVRNAAGGYTSPSATSWYIGNSAYGYGTNGGIGSLRLYTRGLTANEVVALYEEELAGCPTTLNRYRPRTIFLGSFTASPQTATPGVAALTTARYAPSIALPKLATPGIKALATARYAPAAATPRLATPAVQSLATARYAPSIALPKLATPAVQSLATARYAPTASTPRLATPGAQSLATASYAPSIALPQTVTPSTQALSLTCYSLHVIDGITPGTASLSLTCYAPVVTGAGPLGGPVTSYASISPLVTSTVSLQLSIEDSSVLVSQVESSLSIRT